MDAMAQTYQTCVAMVQYHATILNRLQEMQRALLLEMKINVEVTESVSSNAWPCDGKDEVSSVHEHGHETYIAKISG